MNFNKDDDRYIYEIVSENIKYFRMHNNSKYSTYGKLTQEKLAELSGCHPTYIGQLERGEKNATLESIEKIAGALNVPISKLVEQIGKSSDAATDIPLECYHFLCKKTYKEQEALYQLLLNADAYKSL